MTSRRILRVITRMNAGGPARHVAWVSEGLAARGWETRLLTGDVAAGEDDLSGVADGRGVDLRRIPGLSRDIDPLRDGAALANLVAAIREFAPHVVHTHMTKAGLLGRAAVFLVNATRRRAARIRAVHTFHGNVLSGHFPPVQERAFRGIERLLAHRATDAILVLSPQQHAEIVERFRISPAEKVSIVPLALDLGVFATLPPRGAFRREMGFTDDAFVVGIVGRIAPIKNHEMFLRVAARTLQAAPHARFVVVGGGPAAPSLARMARDLGIEGAVRFAGLRTDLAQVYSDLDAVALTSRNEGTPLSLIEAMASGRAVVATDVGGVRDLLTGEWSGSVGDRRFAVSESARGILVEPEDVEGFAAALGRLESDESLRRGLGAAGRLYAHRSHALPRLLDDLEEVYARVLAT
ncbi:MAG: glycosyltransferase [Thermoanaerobaculia bacterium]